MRFIIFYTVWCVVNWCGFIPNVGTDEPSDQRRTLAGPQRDRVAAALTHYRDQRRLSLTGLAERLAAVGHPLRSTALHKIEQRERKVDVDDLVALALALDVSPLRLLLPGDVDKNDAVELTAGVSMTASEAWFWADGRLLWSAAPWRREGVAAGRDLYRFRTESRPLERHVSLPDMLANGAELQEAAQAVRAVSARTGYLFSEVLDAVEQLAREMGQAEAVDGGG